MKLSALGLVRIICRICFLWNMILISFKYFISKERGQGVIWCLGVARSSHQIKKQQTWALNTLDLFHPSLPAITILPSPAALSSSVTPGPLTLATDTCLRSRVLREGNHGKTERSSPWRWLEMLFAGKELNPSHTVSFINVFVFSHSESLPRKSACCVWKDSFYWVSKMWLITHFMGESALLLLWTGGRALSILKSSYL